MSDTPKTFLPFKAEHPKPEPSVRFSGFNAVKWMQRVEQLEQRIWVLEQALMEATAEKPTPTKSKKEG